MDYDGIGAFFYQPPIILGKRDLQSKSGLDLLPGFRKRKIVLSHYLHNSTKIVITDDGFIGIFERGIAYVLKILNTIFATGITWGLGSESVREPDLCKFTLTNNESCIQLNPIGGPSERNMYSFQRDSGTGPDWDQVQRREVSVDGIRGILDRSYDYLAIQNSKKDLYEDLLLLLDGYTLYYKDSFRAAYMFGWMIIESVIDHIWKEYVMTLKTSSEDKKD